MQYMSWRHIFQFYKIHGNNTIDIMDELKKLSYITTCKDHHSIYINNNVLQKSIIGDITWSIINESVTSIFNKLKTSRHADFIWISKIILNIPTPLFVSSLLPPSITPISTTEIVSLLQVLSLQLGIIVKHQLYYPAHCNLCLEEYNGITDSERFASNIIATALKMEHHQR